jgi:two-component system response regulator MprA
VSASVRPRIAVVDDEENLREVLELGLTQEGFEVRTAPDGATALTIIRAWQPEAIVLDVTMPVIDGISLIALVRKFSQAPILLLTAHGGLRDRIAGLKAGADDYLVKPFDLAELSERLRTALRRPYLQQGEQLRYADLVLDLNTRTTRRGGREISLSAREFDLAAIFIGRRVFTRDELLDLAWGADREVTRGTVESYISYLRSKIDAPPARPLIHTVRGVGYVMREMYE